LVSETFHFVGPDDGLTGVVGETAATPFHN